MGGEKKRRNPAQGGHGLEAGWSTTEGKGKKDRKEWKKVGNDMKRDTWDSDVANFITYSIKIYILKLQGNSK